MNWIFLSLCSAVFLGFYEIAKKVSLRNNAVPPVLFFNVLTQALVWLPMVLMSRFAPQWMPSERLIVDSVSWQDHAIACGEVTAGRKFVDLCFVCDQAPADFHRSCNSRQQSAVYGADWRSRFCRSGRQSCSGLA